MCPPHSQAPRPLVPGSEHFRPPQPVSTDTHPVASTVWAVSAAQAPVAPACPASVASLPPQTRAQGVVLAPFPQCIPLLRLPPKSSSGPIPFSPRPEPGFTHPGAQPLRVSAASPCPASPPGKPLWCPLGVCETAQGPGEAAPQGGQSGGCWLPGWKPHPCRAVASGAGAFLFGSESEPPVCPAPEQSTQVPSAPTLAQAPGVGRGPVRDSR